MAANTPRYSLLDVAPEFGAGIPAAERPTARGYLGFTGHRLAKGPFAVEDLADPGSPLLVARGVVFREQRLDGNISSSWLAPGDLLMAHAGARNVTWSAVEPAIVLVLDERLDRAAQRWPAVALAVRQRLAEQVSRLAEQVAISHLARVELRLLAALSQLADRIGVVTDDHVRVPLALTHERLGQLVGARRPTVSLAMTALADSGAVTRDEAGGWRLRTESQHGLRDRALEAS